MKNKQIIKIKIKIKKNKKIKKKKRNEVNCSEDNKSNKR